jgi:hypothetical protein
MSRSFANIFLIFFESDKYLNLVSKKIVPTIRTFETKFTFGTLWRMQHDIDFNCSYQTTNYKYLTHKRVKSIFSTTDINNNLFIHLDYDVISRIEKESGLPLSLADCNDKIFYSAIPKRVAFDIETNNFVDTLVESVFPTPKWTPANYSNRYKSILKQEEKSYISNAKNNDEARKKTVDTLTKNEKAI